jgi:predicted Ser/Thr protein kinase
VTFQQLLECLQNEVRLESKVYRNEYRPYEQVVKIKEEPRKDHNIVIEAKLVRLLKRNKTSLPVEWLAKESGYEESIVALAMKRLCNKGIAEDDEKESYSYVP